MNESIVHDGMLTLRNERGSLTLSQCQCAAIVCMAEMHNRPAQPSASVDPADAPPGYYAEAREGCFGCAFAVPGTQECNIGPSQTCCTPEARDDGCSVIFRKEEGEDYRCAICAMPKSAHKDGKCASGVTCFKPKELPWDGKPSGSVRAAIERGMADSNAGRVTEMDFSKYADQPSGDDAAVEALSDLINPLYTPRDNARNQLAAIRAGKVPTVKAEPYPGLVGIALYDEQVGMRDAIIARLAAQVEAMRQAHWTGRAIGGFDNDGDKTPRSIVSDFAKLIVDDWTEMRRELDESRSEADAAKADLAATTKQLDETPAKAEALHRDLAAERERAEKAEADARHEKRRADGREYVGKELARAQADAAWWCEASRVDRGAADGARAEADAAKAELAAPRQQIAGFQNLDAMRQSMVDTADENKALKAELHVAKLSVSEWHADAERLSEELAALKQSLISQVKALIEKAKDRFERCGSDGLTLQLEGDSRAAAELLRAAGVEVEP